MTAAQNLQAEIDALQLESDDLLDAFVSASGSEKDTLKDELVAKQNTIKALQRELKDIQVKSLEQIVAGLREIVANEAAGQADIIGRIGALIERISPSRSDTDTAAAPTPPGAQPQSAGGSGPAPAATVASTEDPNKRYTSLELLHPKVRGKVEALVTDLAKDNIPMKVFESFRSPERQQKLFDQGRRGPDADKPIVSNAEPWESYHQYGLAVDMVISKSGVNPWETGTEETRAWWKRYHELAEKNGLEPLSFELPHVQLKGIRASQFLSGEEPGDGDTSWEENFVAALNRWPREPKPPIPGGERPPLSAIATAAGMAASNVDWAALPAVKEQGFTARFGGQEWRVDKTGVFLKGKSKPERTPGDPTTTTKVIELYADAIRDASVKFQLPPELIVMTIATETAAFRDHGFTGPKTFRWESHFLLGFTDSALDGTTGDYSAGPMQVMSSTAREMNVKKLSGEFDSKTDLKWFERKPSPIPKSLGLYDARICIMVGASYIAHQSSNTGLNPILVAASYNAGSIRASGTSAWRIHAHGDHLDRSAAWFGDACAAFATFGR